MAGTDVIFDDGAPDLKTAWEAGYDSGPYDVFDDFVLAPGANVITEIHWWGTYNGAPPAKDFFHINILTFPEGEGPLNFLASEVVCEYVPDQVNREFVRQDQQSLHVDVYVAQALVTSTPTVMCCRSRFP